MLVGVYVAVEVFEGVCVNVDEEVAVKVDVALGVDEGV